MSTALDSLPRRWWSVDLPGYRPAPELSTYAGLDQGSLPPIERELDQELRWLCREPAVSRSLAEEEPAAVRPVTSAELAHLTVGRDVRIPRDFTTFVESPEPRRRVRSCTDCYLDLGDFIVPVEGGGWLVHFLSDSQGVLHWSLYTSADHELVVTTDAPVGFEAAEDTVRVFDPGAGDGAICADSFSEFLYRFWIENEIWFALASENRSLTKEQRRYAEYYLY